MVCNMLSATVGQTPSESISFCVTQNPRTHINQESGLLTKRYENMIARPDQSEVVISPEIRLPPTSPDAAQKLAEACLDAYPGKLVEIAHQGIRTVAYKESPAPQRQRVIVTETKHIAGHVGVGRMDLYTDDGAYIFSVMQGRDGQWRRVYMYIDSQGVERITNICVEYPDYQNKFHMNIQE